MLHGLTHCVHLSSHHIIVNLLCIFTLPPFAGFGVGLVAQVLQPGCIVVRHLPVQAPLPLLALCQQPLHGTGPSEGEEKKET